MAYSFDTFDGAHDVPSAPVRAVDIAGADGDKIVLTPREAEQTQVNRLAFVGIAVVGLLIIAAVSLVF